MAKKSVVKGTGEYVAYALFAWKDKEYDEGDAFTPPTGYKRDSDFEIFRNIEKTSNPSPGIPFLYEVQVAERRLDSGERVPVMDTRRVIFPVVERVVEPAGG